MGVVLGQNLGQIRPNIVKKNKEMGIINSFFSIISGCTSEWANIARNATFEGCLGPNICLIRVKNDKKLIIFKNFSLVSLP